MPVLRIAVHLGSLQLPLKKALLTAARLGADAVEIDARRQLRPDELSQTGLRQLRKMLNDLNLRIASISFPTQRGYNVVEDLDRRVAATKNAMQLACDLGCNVVVNSIGVIPTDQESSDWSLLVQVLNDLGIHGDRVGARLAAQTGSADGPDLKRLMDSLNEGALGVDFDPGGLIVNEFSPREMIDAVGQHIIHVHARDAVHDLARGRGLEVALGRGSADFPNLLGALEEHEYRGYLTIERRTSKDPTQEIGDAIQYLRSL